MSVSDTQGFRLEDQYSLEKHIVCHLKHLSEALLPKVQGPRLRLLPSEESLWDTK